MHCAIRFWKSISVIALSLFLLPAVTQAQHYTQKNLVSDVSQPDNADKTKVLLDKNLKNPWGLTRSSGSPWWVGNNNSGTSTVYGSDGTTATPAGFLPDPPGNKNPDVSKRIFRQTIGTGFVAGYTES